MEFLGLQLETKALSEDGSFEGYAAVFGNVDLGFDVIEKEAFKEIVTGKNGRVKVLNMHNMRDPIGTAEVTQDSKGLKFKGALVLGVPSADNAYRLMKADALDGMSIGYDVLPGGAEYTNAGVRRLKALKLYEISPVTFGMNPKAGITGVKSGLQDITTVRQFEDFLRDAGGFSAAQAKALASGGFKVLQTSRDETGSNTGAKELAELIGTIRTAGY
jgi:HK97 family phage prohead protease